MHTPHQWEWTHSSSGSEDLFISSVVSHMRRTDRASEEEEDQEVVAVTVALELARSRLQLARKLLTSTAQMLPYPSSHHFGVSQEHPHPNPTGFPMLPPAAHLDQHYADHFFPGHGQFNSETLEAVLRPPRAAPECEAVVTAPQGGRNGAAAAGQGHARARKRPFRTDRHSKIRTAQGVRDRRMRLSLDVARDFFALQDRLGFDKASKTVDWLLTQSKPAIDRLTEPSQQSIGVGSDAALSPPTTGAPHGGSGKRGGVVEKVGPRNGGSAFMEQSCELDRLVSAAPVLGEYYYAGLSEMMSNNGAEGDDDGDGEYEEDGDDFLDGMQY